MRFVLIISCVFHSLTAIAQRYDHKDYFLIWTFDQDSIRIHGVSIGFLTDNVSAGNTLTNGLRIELLGLGFLLPILPSSSVADSAEELESVFARGVNQKVNGFNLSTTGTTGNCHINGISAGAIGQSLLQVNGVALSAVMNLIQKHNGLMLALFNDSFIIHGAQFGCGNKAVRLNGLQLAAINNYAQSANGVQIGFVNKCEKLRGFQFGFWNVNQKRRMPLVNWAFISDK
jgi:hypothetical protein